MDKKYHIQPFYTPLITWSLEPIPGNPWGARRGANPAQGTITQYVLQCMSLDWRIKPEYVEETRGACEQHTPERMRDSNPQPWKCEANVPTTKAPCPEKLQHGVLK